MILITGGSGLVGAHLLLQLIQKNEPVRAIYRTTSNLEKVKTVFSYYTENATALFNKIDWVEADITDVPSLEIAFKGVTHVYHCAALISFDPNDYELLCKTNTEGTANIVNVCIANSIQKLCYVSSIAAIGKPTQNMLADEETEWTPQDANVYALSKYEAEMEVWRGTIENVPAVIVNPGVILGPGFWENGSGTLFTTVAKNRPYYPPNGTGFITVHDVVKMMTLLMSSDIINERFIAVAQNKTFKEIMHDISTNMNLKPPTKELKIWQLQILWRLDWLRNFITGSKRKLSKNDVLSLKEQTIFDNQKIKKSIAFEFEPLDETIAFCSKKSMTP